MKKKRVFYFPIPEKLVSRKPIPDDIPEPYIPSNPKKSRKNSKKKRKSS